MNKLNSYAAAFAIFASAYSVSSFAHTELDEHSYGAVFTMDNATEANAVIMFARTVDGQLNKVGMFPTNGKGTGKGLGNQGGVILTENHRWLFAVNAGSNEISVFKVMPSMLVLTDKIASGGMMPISLTVDDNILYVLNAGSDEISGFKFSDNGKLKPVDNSTRALSGKGTAPAEIKFSPNGSVLIVTEKATNTIDSFVVDKHGVAGDVMTTPSAGTTPFGFAFNRRGDLIVSEAEGGAPNGSSASSYDVHRNGNVELISSAVPTTETAACWVAVTDNGRYAYVANAGSSSVSGYKISRDGSINLLNADGVTGSTGAGTHPTDMALSDHSHFLYVLSTATGSISGFKVNMHGSLMSMVGATGLPTTVNGIAAY